MEGEGVILEALSIILGLDLSTQSSLELNPWKYLREYGHNPWKLSKVIRQCIKGRPKLQ